MLSNNDLNCVQAGADDDTAFGAKQKGELFVDV